MPSLKRSALVGALVFLAACAYGLWYVYGAWPVPAGYEFPRHSMFAGMEALFEGTLVDVDGCIRGKAGEGGAVTVVWPPGYSLSVEAGRPVVHGAGRNIEMGEPVRLGGGEVSRAHLEGMAGGAAATSCPGPFFLTTGLAD